MRILVLALCLTALAHADTTVPAPPAAEPTPAQLMAELERVGHVAVYRLAFATAKADLRPGGEPLLEALRAWLAARPEARLRVEVHSDARGASEFNRKLSQERAEAVVAWLGLHGIARARLEAAGLGEQRPLSQEPTPAAWAKNRRVELWIIRP